MKKSAFILFLFLFTTSTFCSKSDSLHIYLLTYTPGKELYSTFGHSSIRVKDMIAGTDKVYNYGTFNFKTKNFYFKFFKGNLNYYLSKVNTNRVLRTTNLEKRSISQNELLLSSIEKRKLLLALENNYLPENREYRYDFLYDNCATRIFYLIDSITGGRYSSNLNYSNPRFNTLVNEYLYNHPLAKLGFNLFAGKQILKKTNAIESIFLPDYLKYYLNSLSYKSKNLIGPDQVLVYNVQDIHKKSLFKWIFICLLVFGLLIRLIEVYIKKTYSFWSILILTVPGVIVLISCLLWLVSDHQIYAWNFNLLWAAPSLLIVILNKSKNKTKFLLILPILLGIVCVVVFLGGYFPMLTLIFLALSRIKLYNNLKLYIFPDIL